MSSMSWLVGCWKLFLNAEEWRSGGWRFCVARGGRVGIGGERERESGSFTLASFIGNFFVPFIARLSDYFTRCEYI